MSKPLLFAVPVLILVRSSLFGQITEAKLTSSYRSAGNGVFLFDASTELRAVFDKTGEACTLVLRGQVSEAKVFHIFDVLVPAKARGVKKQDLLECVGTCQRNLVYENVALVTGVVGNQTSEPAAIITFSRPDCKTAVAEVQKTVLHIKH